MIADAVPIPACEGGLGGGGGSSHQIGQLIAPSGRRRIDHRQPRRAARASARRRAASVALGGSPSASSLGRSRSATDAAPAARAPSSPPTNSATKSLGRPLQHLERRAPLREPAALQDRDDAGQPQRLLDVVGHEHDGLLASPAGCAASRPATRRGSPGRPRRTARPSAAGRGRRPARGRRRPAAARRPTAGAGTCRDRSRGRGAAARSNSVTRSRTRCRGHFSRRGTVAMLSSTRQCGNSPIDWIA